MFEEKFYKRNQTKNRKISRRLADRPFETKNNKKQRDHIKLSSNLFKGNVQIT